MSKEGTQDSSAVTNGVRIVERSEYLDEESSPRMQRYVFSYSARIHNESAVTVQLMGRHSDGRSKAVASRSRGSSPLCPMFFCGPAPEEEVA